MTTTPNSTDSTTRQLEEAELDSIVGGVTSPASQKTLNTLVQEDLVGHTTGHNESAQIAAMVVHKSVTAQDVIQAIETTAAQDGKHSADQELLNVQAALNKDHASAASAAFTKEEATRVSTGVASSDLGHLVATGAMTGSAAATTLQNEAHAASPSSLGNAMLGLEKAAGGDAGIETSIGHLVRAGTVTAASAISAVETANTGHHSIDQALVGLDSAAGGNKAIETEESKRLQDGAAASDLAAMIASGHITGASAASTIEAAATHAKASGFDALAGLEKATGGNAAVEAQLVTMLQSSLLNGSAEAALAHDVAAGNLTAAQALNFSSEALATLMTQGKVTAANAASMIELVATQVHASATDAMASLADATGGKNATIETQLVNTLASGLLDGSAENTLVSQIAAGTMSATQALNLATQALAVGQPKNSGGGPAILQNAATQALSDVLTPTLAQADIMLARLANAAQAEIQSAPTGQAQVQQFENAISSYVTAIDVGNSLIPLVDSLGPTLTTAALSAGQQIAASSTGSQGTNPSTIISNLEQQARTAGGSVDGVLAVAAIGAGGSNAALNQEINTRLQSGAAAANLSALITAGTLSGADAAAIIAAEARGTSLDAVSAIASLERTTGGNAGVTTALGQAVAASYYDASDAQIAITAVEVAAIATGHSVDQALVNLNTAAGGNTAIAAEEAHRLAIGNTPGAAISDLAVQVESGILTGAAAAAIIEQEAQQAGTGTAVTATAPVQAGTLAAYALGGLYTMTHNADVKAQLLTTLQAGLLNGQAESALASLVYSGYVTPQGAIDLANQAVVQAQQTPGSGVLPGAAEGEVVLAQLNAAVSTALTATGYNPNSNSAGLISNAVVAGGFGSSGPPAGLLGFDSPSNLAALSSELMQTYSVAIGIGNAMLPLVRDLGPSAAANALAAGQQLAAIADPTTGAESSIVANLVQSAQSAGLSVDAALTLASFTANGQSQVLKLEMTDRLLSGSAESDVANLAANGIISANDAITILTQEVGALISSNASGGALGFDGATATSLVLAKLDLAAATLTTSQVYSLGGNGPQGYVVSAGGQALQTTLEATYAPQILTGLGAQIGLLSADPTTNAAALGAAQSLVNHLLPAATGMGLIDSIYQGTASTDTSNATATLTNAAAQQIQNLINAYDAAKALGDAYTFTLTTHADNLGTKENPTKATLSPSQGNTFTASIQSYSFTEFGVGVGSDASTSFDFGSGFGLTLDANATAAAGVKVDATQVTVQAAAQASAMGTIDLGGHAQLMALAQAIANGAVVAGITGVTAQANVAVGASVTATQTEQGSLGVSGLTGMENSSITAGVVAGAEGKASVGLDNEITYGTMVGAYISAGANANIAIGGVQIGGGGAVLSPGTVGISQNVTANFTGGNINIAFSQTIGAELFGVSFNGNITLPTGAVVGAVESLSGDFAIAGTAAGNAVASAAQTVASEAQSIANEAQAVANQVASTLNSVGSTIEHGLDSIGSFFGL